MSSRVKLQFHRYDYAVFLTFFAYAASSLVIPVSLLQIADTLGFPLADGGMGTGGTLQLARTVSMTTLLVISGFIAGRFGLRRSLGWGVLVMALGCLGAALANSYLVLFCMILLAGCGEGYIEAIGTPFVQKLHTENTSQYMNFAHSFWSVGVTVVTIGAGLALMCGLSWRLVVGSAFAIALFPAVMLLLPEAPGHAYPEERTRLSLVAVAGQMRAIARVPRFWLFFLMLFIAGGAEYCLTFWLASFLQLSMQSSAFVGGLATATFAAGMMTGRMGWGIFVPQKKLGLSLLIANLAGVALSCAIPFLKPDLPIGRTGVLIILFALLYLIGLTIAPLWPSLQTYAVIRLPKHLDETMVFVLLSCAGVPGCGCFATVMGYVGDACGGLDSAFFMVPACQLGLVICLLADMLHRRQD